MPGWNILKGHVEFLWNTHTSPVTSKVTHSPAKVGEYSGGGGGDAVGREYHVSVWKAVGMYVYTCWGVGKRRMHVEKC